MTNPETLAGIENALRRAVLAEQFDLGRTLLGRYVDRLERQLAAAPVGPEAAATLEKRAHALLEWTGALVHAARHRAAAEARQLETLSRYYPAPGSTRHSTQA